jgi:hypothetical protein
VKLSVPVCVEIRLWDYMTGEFTEFFLEWVKPVKRRYHVVRYSEVIGGKGTRKTRRCRSKLSQENADIDTMTEVLIGTMTKPCRSGYPACCAPATQCRMAKEEAVL